MALLGSYGEVRCLAELCLRSLRRKCVKLLLFGLQLGTWVLPFHFKHFLISFAPSELCKAVRMFLSGRLTQLRVKPWSHCCWHWPQQQIPNLSSALSYHDERGNTEGIFLKPAMQRYSQFMRAVVLLTSCFAPG